jgi:crotonobetainyl-CoA:carnitine CoA-transferase CaiB-like acyl-CoA transferase
MMLADMGATIFKIEPPEGDPNRQLGPFLNDEDKDMGLGGFYSSINRNKKSIALDLKQPDAQKVAQQLAAECDAMIFNFSSPKILDKFSLDYDTVNAINPRIVYVSISGYGTNRIVPTLHEGKPTIDMMMQAESGTLSITGAPTGEVYKVGPGIGDTYAGTLAIVAMLAALLKAKETGKGQFIDIAMLDSMVMLSERIIYQYSYTGVSPGPIGNRHPLQAPYSVYNTTDGSIVLAAFPDRYWDKLVEVLDIDILRTDQRFTTREARLLNQDALDEIISSWTTKRTKQEAMDILDGTGCLASPVNVAGDLFNNEQIEKREMIIEVEGHPKTGEKVQITGSALKFSETPIGIYRRAPLNGEDSRDILGQLGYSTKEIDRMIGEGTVIHNHV